MIVCSKFSIPDSYCNDSITEVEAIEFPRCVLSLASKTDIEFTNELNTFKAFPSN